MEDKKQKVIDLNKEVIALTFMKSTTLNADKRSQIDVMIQERVKEITKLKKEIEEDK
jgi:hypothetical protein